MNKRYPRYPDDADYQTNAPSYYEDLARKHKLIQLLAEKIWEYENTLDETLEQIEQRLTDYITENDILMNERLENWDQRIAEMPEEMRSLFVTWLNDGTLEQIINHDVLGNKADKTYVDSEIENLTTKLEEIAYLKPNGVDDTQAIRDILSQGKKLRLIHTGEPFKITSAIVRTSDVFNVDIEGQGGIPTIELISEASKTDNNVNSIFKPGGSTCLGFRLRNLHLKGNWDGENTPGLENGVGVWLTPSENYIADIDGITAEHFTQYGIYFYVNKAIAGTIHSNHCRVQGTAIVNVRDELTIDYVGGHSNGTKEHSSIMGAGIDIELSTNRGMGIKNVTINTVNVRDNTRGIVINSGNATDESIELDNYSSDDFGVNIGNIYAENNYQDGVLIDFPNVKIGNIWSKGNALRSGLFAGVLIRNVEELSKHTISINNIFSSDDGVGFSTSTNSNSLFRYQHIYIGVLSVKNSVKQGIYLAGNMANQGFVIDSVVDHQVDGTVSSIDTTNVTINNGSLFGSEFDSLKSNTMVIKVPNGLSEQKSYRLKLGAYVKRIIVDVEEATSEKSNLRIRRGGKIVLQVNTATVGVREIGIFENNVLSDDSGSQPMGDSYKESLTRIEPTNNPLPEDGKITLYVEYNSRW